MCLVFDGIGLFRTGHPARAGLKLLAVDEDFRFVLALGHDHLFSRHPGVVAGFGCLGGHAEGRLLGHLEVEITPSPNEPPHQHGLLRLDV